jgi:hypothetical protein
MRACCRAAVAAYRTIEARLPQVFDAVRHGLGRVNAELTEYWAALIMGDLASAEIAATQCEAAAAVFRVPQLSSLVALIRIGRALGDGRLDDASVCSGISRMSPSCTHDSRPMLRTTR